MLLKDIFVSISDSPLFPIFGAEFGVPGFDGQDLFSTGNVDLPSLFSNHFIETTNLPTLPTNAEVFLNHETPEQNGFRFSFPEASSSFDANSLFSFAGVGESFTGGFHAEALSFHTPSLSEVTSFITIDFDHQGNLSGRDGALLSGFPQSFGSGAVFSPPSGGPTSSVIAGPFAQPFTAPAFPTIPVFVTPVNNTSHAPEIPSIPLNATISGGDGGDFLRGTSINNVLSGGLGNDTIIGGSGNNTIIGGFGDNLLTGGGGINTFVFGSNTAGTNIITNFVIGKDHIQYDGTFNDLTVVTIPGGTSISYNGTVIELQGITGISLDVILGIAGTINVIQGTSPGDTLTGHDPSLYYTGNDSLYGDTGGGSTFNGLGGNDLIVATGGNNTVEGGLGNDTISVQGGSNVIVYDGTGNGNDTVTGFVVGSDTIQYSGITNNDFTGITVVDNGSTHITFADGTTVQLTGVTGTTLDQILGAEAITGNGLIVGYDPTPLYHTGNDTLIGGSGDDTLVGLGGDDTMTGNGGSDVFQFSGSSQGHDTILDFLVGTDRLSYSGVTNNDFTGFSVNVSSGTTHITYQGTQIDLSGVTGATLDEIFGNLAITGNGLIQGYDATPLFHTGNDTLIGGSGNDTLNGRGGNDSLTGGGGNDLFVYNGSASGTDIITDFNPGSDHISYAGISDNHTNIYSGVNFLDDLTSTHITFADSTVITLFGVTGKKLDELLTPQTITGSGAINGFNIDSLHSGNDTLQGSSGSDTLTGLGGNDLLTGGNGSDVFAYTNATSGNDTITDFNVGQDRVSLFGLINNDFSSIGVTVDSAFHINFGNGTIQLDGVTNTTLEEILGPQTIFGSVLVQGYDAQANLHTGNDTLQGSGTSDVLQGKGGNDLIIGAGGNDSFDGGSGNDTMIGGSGNDTFLGGLGSDSMDGTSGSDLFVYSGAASGTDTIDNFTVGVDRIDFGGIANNNYAGITLNDDGTDTHITFADGTIVNLTGVHGAILEEILGAQTITGSGLIQGYDSLAGLHSGNDTLQGSSSDDTLQGKGGNDLIQGGGGNDSFDGGSGNDTMIGSAGNDTFNGGLGNDSMDGTTGLDLFVYSGSNSGNDTIANFTANTDRISYGGITNNNYSGVTYNDNGTDTHITFADGTIVNLTGVHGFILEDLLGKQTITGSGLIQGYDSQVGFHTGNDTLQGSATGDVLQGKGGNDLLIGGGGNDSFDGGAGNDTMTGGAGDDTFSGGGGADVFNLSGGSNLLLYSGGDSGHDTVNGFTIGVDFLSYNGLPPNDYSSIGINDNGSRTILTFTDGTTIEFTSVTGSSVEEFFSQGIITGSGLITGFDPIPSVRSGNDTIIGSEGNDTIVGLGGNDSIIGVGGDDSFDGGTGNDIMTGGSGNDTFLGGLGNDRMDGTDGSDLFVYQVVPGGSGNDTIANFTVNTDRISFSGITNNDYTGITYNDDGSDTHITFADGTIVNLIGVHGTILEDILGAQTITGSGLIQGYDPVAGLHSGNDTIVGSSGNDTLVGGLGNDLMDGTTGSDRFDYNVVTVPGGSGNDTIANFTVNNDLIRFNSITSNDYTGVTFNDNGTDTHVTFADGTIINLIGVHGALLEDILGKQTITGSGLINGYDFQAGLHSGNDTIQGSSGSDTIEGKGGSDEIYGAGGNDVFVYNGTGTSGDDTIGDFQAGQDHLSYAGIVNNDFTGISIFDDGGDTHITFADGTTVLLVGQTGNTLDELLLPQTITGSGLITGFDAVVNFHRGNDTLQGGAGNDTLVGLGGSDSLLGAGGNDSFDGGDGNDTMIGSTGNDTFHGGAGDDVMTSGSGNDTFIYSIGTDGNDTITDFTRNVDVLSYLGGIGYTDLYLTENNDTSVTITILSTGETIELQGTGFTGLSLGEIVKGNITANSTVPSQLVGSDSVSGGWSGSDTITGSNLGDYLEGRGGNDLITTGLGTDTIFYTIGFDGNDTVTDFTRNVDYLSYNGSFNDITDFSVISDSLATLTFAGGSVLTLQGSGFTGMILQEVVKGQVHGSDDSSLLMGSDSNGAWLGTDTIVGGNGNDTLIGLGGNDVLVGGIGDDSLNGGSGNDTLQSSNTVNPFFSFLGNDTYFGGDGDDLIIGSQSADVFQYNIFGSGNDTITNFTLGTDRISYSGFYSQLSISTANPAVLSFTGGTIRLNGIDNTGGNVDIAALLLGQVTGSITTASSLVGSNAVGAWQGNDTITGGIFSDTLVGLGGNDSMNGGAGNDSFIGGAGNDTMIGGSGNDIFVYTLGGTDGNDTITDFRPSQDVLQVNFTGGANFGSMTFSVTSTVTGSSSAIITDTVTGSTIVLQGPSGVSYSGLSLAEVVGGSIVGGNGNIALTGSNANANTGWLGNDTFYLQNDTGSQSVNPLGGNNLIYTTNIGGASTGINASGGNDTIVTAGSWYAVMGASGSLTVLDSTLGGTHSGTIEPGPSGVLGNGNATIDASASGTGSIYINGRFVISGNQYIYVGPQVTTVELGIGSSNQTIDGSGKAGVWLIYNHPPGTGSDTIGTGNHTIYGGTSNLTTIIGGAGTDSIVGGSGNESLNAGIGNGTAGAEYIDGGAGNDTINGNTGRDILIGGTGNDVISTGGGNDTIYDSNPTVVGATSTGNDLITGGAGADIIVYKAGDAIGTDTINSFTRGSDKIQYTGYFNEVSLSGAVMTFTTTTGSVSITGASGAPVAELLGGVVNGSNNVTTATLTGSDSTGSWTGNDTITGGSGNDSILGLSGNDSIIGGGGSDTIAGGAGNDTILTGATGTSIITGGDGSDSITSGNSTDTFVYTPATANGADTIFGFTVGTDKLQYSTIANNDYAAAGITATISGGSTTVTFGSFGSVVLNGISGPLLEQIFGTQTISGSGLLTGYNTDAVYHSGNDTIIGSSGSDTITGLGGNDTISSGAGSDSITGGAGNDTLTTGTGNDIIVYAIGSDGNDTITDFRPGIDTLNGADILKYSGNFNSWTFSVTSTVAGSSSATITDTVTGSTIVLQGAGAPSYNGLSLAEVVGGSIVGGAGAVTLNGSNANTLTGWLGNDTITAGSGTDQINPLGGNNVIFGSAVATSSATINGAATANDTLFGGGSTLGSGSAFVYVASGGKVTVGNGGGSATTLIYPGNGNTTIDASDALSAGEGTIYINGNSVTSGNQSITVGTRVSTVELGRGTSNQTIDASASTGNHLFTAGNNATLTGGSHTILGGSGNSTFTGGTGTDVYIGSTGNDNLNAGVGSGVGTQSLDGGAGNDTINGNTGSDILIGGTGNDVISTGGGNDTVYDSNPTVVGVTSTGSDVITGGAGIDIIVYKTGDAVGADTVNSFTRGTDKIQYNGFFSDMTVTGATLTFNGGSGTTGSVSITGSAAPLAELLGGVVNGSNNVTTATLTGSDTVPASLGGWSGNDTITGGSGNDSILGLSGNDSITSNAGNDTILAGAGNDFVNAGTGNDSISGGAGSDSLTTGTGNDIIAYAIGSDGSDTITDFRPGIDTLNGADVLRYSGGDISSFTGFTVTSTVAGSSSATITVGGSTIVLQGTGGPSYNGLSLAEVLGGSILGGNGGLTINGSNPNTLTGWLGNDTFYLQSDTGTQSINPLGGSNVIYTTTVTGARSNINGGGGFDTIIGGAGPATWQYGMSGGSVSVDGSSGTATNGLIYVGGGTIGTPATIDASASLAGASTVYINGGGTTSGYQNILIGANVTVVELGAGTSNQTIDGGARNGTGGRAGNWIIYNNSGVSGTGNHTIYGGSGSPSIGGGYGTDVILGGSGNEQLNAGHGNANGAEYLDGGAGNDTLSGSADTVVANGTNYGAVLIGGTGNDVINAGFGNDTIYDSSPTVVGSTTTGSDLMTGSAAAVDTFVYKAGDAVGADTINTFTRGTDKIQYTGYFSDMTISGATLTFNGGSGTTGSVSITGASGAPLGELLGGLINGSNNVTNATLTGSDTTASWSGNDTITGGSGNDSISGLTGNDSINGGGGNDIIDGGIGNDTINTGNYGSPTVTGGLGNDVINAGTAFDTFTYLNSANGSDTINNFALGYDKLQYSGTITNNDFAAAGISISTVSGSSVVTFGSFGSVTLSGVVGYLDEIFKSQTLSATVGGSYSGWDIDTLNLLHSGNDVLLGSNGIDTLTGLSGNDFLFGFIGNDSLSGGLGNDTLWGSVGSDTMTGGLGNDIFFYAFGDGNDTITDFARGTDFLQFSNSTYTTGSLSLTVTSGTLATINVTGGSTIVLQTTVSGAFTGMTIDEVLGYISGTTGNDVLGSSSDSTVSSIGQTFYGDTGNDTIYGGKGSDTMWGGGSIQSVTDANVFAFPGSMSTNFDNDVIKDFHVGIDKMDLTFNTLNSQQVNPGGYVGIMNQLLVGRVYMDLVNTTNSSFLTLDTGVLGSSTTASQIITGSTTLGTLDSDGYLLKGMLDGSVLTNNTSGTSPVTVISASDSTAFYPFATITGSSNASIIFQGGTGQDFMYSPYAITQTSTVSTTNFQMKGGTGISGSGGSDYYLWQVQTYNLPGRAVIGEGVGNDIFKIVSGSVGVTINPFSPTTSPANNGHSYVDGFRIGVDKINSNGWTLGAALADYNGDGVTDTKISASLVGNPLGDIIVLGVADVNLAHYT